MEKRDELLALLALLVRVGYPLPFNGRGLSFGPDPSLAIVPVGGVNLLPNFHAKKISIFLHPLYCSSGITEVGFEDIYTFFVRQGDDPSIDYLTGDAKQKRLTTDESDAGQQEHGRRLIDRSHKRNRGNVYRLLPLKTAASERRGKFRRWPC